MTAVEEFEDKDSRDVRYHELRDKGAPNVSRHSDPEAAAKLVNGKIVWEDRWYVTRGS